MLPRELIHALFQELDLLYHASPLLLVDDDLVLHEVQVTHGVRLRLNAADLADILVSRLPQGLTDLLPVVVAQVVNDGHMVDVLATFRKERIPASSFFRE
jgi:hypothetical protein